MSCCEVLSLGRASDGGGADGWEPFFGEVTTTDATPQVIVVANLPVVGAGVYYFGSARGQETSGERGFRFNFWCDVSRNAIGTGGLNLGVVGPTGYTDAGLVPWSTIAVPVGWGWAHMNIVGDQVQNIFFGAAAQTVEWRWQIDRLLLAGATP